MSPSDSCSRSWLNQATQATVASSTCARERHTRLRSARSCRNQRTIPPARCPRHLRPSRSRRATRGRRAPACSPYSVYCEPASVCATSSKSAPGSRKPSAIRSASSTSVVRMLAASCQPTTIRENTSITKLKYRTPSQQRRYVKSPTQRRFGAFAVKSRLTRSAGLRAAGSASVVRHGFPRRFAPWMLLAAISRCTRQRGTCSPARSERLPHPPIAVRLVVALVRHADHLAQPLVLDLTERTAHRWHAGSTRTPTRPRSGRSARPRSARGADRHRRSPRPVWVELLREKHPRPISRSRSPGADRAPCDEACGSPPAPALVRTSLRLPLVGLRPAHTLAQRLMVDAQISSDPRDRPPGLEHKPDAARHQLIGVLPRSWHERGVPLSRDQPLVSRSPSIPAWPRNCG